MSAPDLPTWHQFMRPVLDVLSDGTERAGRDVKRRVLERVGLTDEQLAAQIASSYNAADDRIGWAMSYLTMATALSRPRRAR